MGLSVASLLLGLGTTRMTRSLYRSAPANPSQATHTQTRYVQTFAKACVPISRTSCSVQVAPELSTVNDSHEDEGHLELCHLP